MKLKKCGFTGRFDLFWLQSVQLKRDSLYLRLRLPFCQIMLLRSLSRACRTDLGLFFLCPLTFLLQLVIMPHQLCSIGFLYILGKGIWKLSNVVKGTELRIHIVSVNPETKFSFMFSRGKSHETKMNLLVLLTVVTWNEHRCFTASDQELLHVYLKHILWPSKQNILPKRLL